MKSRSEIWLIRRTSWRDPDRRRSVSVDGVRFVRADLFELLFNERANLVRKWKAERAKRRAVEQKLRALAEIFDSVRVRPLSDCGSNER